MLLFQKFKSTRKSNLWVRPPRSVIRQIHAWQTFDKQNELTAKVLKGVLYYLYMYEYNRQPNNIKQREYDVWFK